MISHHRLAQLFKFLDTNNIFFTIINYNISYIEFTAIISLIVCVWLVAQANIWNWPFGIIGVTLYAIIFYQYQLYSDMFLQCFFLLANCYGWFKWLKDTDYKEAVITPFWASTFENIIFLILMIAGVIGLGTFMSNINHIFPKYFPKPAAFPYIDSTITILSFAATIWQINKRINQWFLWIIVDLIAIIIYYLKQIPFTSCLYVLFLIISINGLIKWCNLNSQKNQFV